MFCPAVVLKEGGYFDFVCPGSNILSTVYFAKDGNPIDLNINGKYSKSSFLLRVNSLTTEDTAIYTCTAAFGRQRTNFCNKLIVNVNPIEKPLIYSTSPKTRTLRQGSSEILVCRAPSAVRVLWYKDEEPLKSSIFSGRIHLKSSFQELHFVTVLPEDSGNYSCEAVNRGGATWKHFERIVQGRSQCITYLNVFVRVFMALIFFQFTISKAKYRILCIIIN